MTGFPDLFSQKLKTFEVGVHIFEFTFDFIDEFFDGSGRMLQIFVIHDSIYSLKVIDHIFRVKSLGTDCLILMKMVIQATKLRADVGILTGRVSTDQDILEAMFWTVDLLGEVGSRFDGLI